MYYRSVLFIVYATLPSRIGPIEVGNNMNKLGVSAGLLSLSTKREESASHRNSFTLPDPFKTIHHQSSKRSMLRTEFTDRAVTETTNVHIMRTLDVTSL
jgi:hypothetical protein